MDPNNEVNQNIASAYLERLALEEKKKNGKHKMPDGSMMRDDDPSMSEDNTNDKSDDGEGLDKVQPKALKKKFKDRKDKDIDNDGDVDKSDEYLDNRRKTVSKAIDKDGDVDQDKPKVTSSDADSEKDNDDDRDEKGSVLKKDNDKKKTAEQTKEAVELDEAKDFKSTFDDLKKGDTVKIKYDGLFSSREKKGTFKVTAKSIVSKFKVGKITLVKQGEDATQDKYYLYDRDGKVSMSMDNMGAKGITRDHNMNRLVKESVDEENLKELGLEILDKMSEAKKPVSQMTPKEKEDDAARRKEYNAYQKSKRGGTKEEGIIDRLLAGKPKGGSKHWVTKKPNTKESVEPSLLMKRILDEKRVGDAEQNIDTWDKQVSNRRADDVLDTEITEKEFMDMHNVDTPEFVDGPKVANKTMDAIKNSVKSKSATRNNDSTIGESVEIEENRITLPLSPEDKKLVSKMYNKDGTLTAIGKRLMDKPVKEENDMYEGMTPMQRALAKVKAQPKDKVSVKKAPWDKDDVKKESVELDDIENINEKNEFSGMKLKYNVADPSAKLDAKFREIQNELKELEKDMMTRKTRSAPYLQWKNDKNPFDDCIDEISNVRNQLKPMMKSSEKAFDAAKKGDQKLSLISIVGVDAAKNMGRQSRKAVRK